MVELRPNHAKSHFNRGVTLSELRRNEEALESIDRAIALDPELGRAHSQRGLLLLRLERFEEAVEAYEVAIARLPDDQQSQHNHSYALAALGRAEEALASAERAHALDPNDGRPYHVRGQALDQLGRHEEAIVALERAMELGCVTPFALRVVAWHYAAALDPAERDPERAVPLATRATELEPGNWGHWLTLGLALYRAGKWQESLEALQKSVKVHGRPTAEAKLLLAMAHTRLGHPEAIARSHYDPVAAWMDEKRPDLELLWSLLAEAEEVLGIEKIDR